MNASPDPSPHITLILPAYNEANSIGNTVSTIVEYFERRKYTYQIIVSADGTDGTRERVAALAHQNRAIQVIGENARGGKGRGIRKGVAIARGRIIGYADADYKVPIEEIEKIEPWLDEGYDVVIGSRALEQSHIEHRP